MKLETRSKKMLAITKSKAKMYELAIDEASHIALPFDPRKLLITTISILGDLSAIEAREDKQVNETDKHEHLKSELISVGQYFDALIESHLADEMTIYLKILGSSAYYLADMPGSSIVLAKNLPYKIRDQLTRTNLEGVLVWILKSNFTENWYCLEQSYLTIAINDLANGARNFFSLGLDVNRFKSQIYTLRKDVLV